MVLRDVVAVTDDTVRVAGRAAAPHLPTEVQGAHVPDLVGVQPLRGCPALGPGTGSQPQLRCRPDPASLRGIPGDVHTHPHNCPHVSTFVNTHVHTHPLDRRTLPRKECDPSLVECGWGHTTRKKESRISLTGHQSSVPPRRRGVGPRRRSRSRGESRDVSWTVGHAWGGVGARRS